jgi:hypothetical protein
MIIIIISITRQTNCMTRMISRDYQFRYHSAYYIVYHRFLPKTYTKLFSIKGCCFCCCCFQCVSVFNRGIRAWFAGYFYKKRKLFEKTRNEKKRNDIQRNKKIIPFQEKQKKITKNVEKICLPAPQYSI